MRIKRCQWWGVSLITSWFTSVKRKNEPMMIPDNEQDAAVQAYVETMSALVLKQELPDTKPDEEARNRALARTAAVLRSVDVARRAMLIRFLSQSGLVALGIGADLQALNLIGSDLSHLNLGKVRLSEANLSHARLMSVDLRGADLRGANLSGAVLRDASVTQEQVQQARQSKSV
jgi:Pentapeptide repeats (8 copies)